MPKVKQRRGAWLGPIQSFLGLLLVLDVIGVPLLIIGHGALPVGNVDVGAIFGGDAYVNRRFPTLDLSTVSVLAFEPTTAQTVLYLVGQNFAFTLATVPMILYAMRITNDARYGDPFTPAMVRRLRKLGLMVLVLGLASEIVETIARTLLLNMSIPAGSSATLHAMIEHPPTFWWLLPGLVLLGVSEVVKRGCDLRDELDGVV